MRSRSPHGLERPLCRELPENPSGKGQDPTCSPAGNSAPRLGGGLQHQSAAHMEAWQGAEGRGGAPGDGLGSVVVHGRTEKKKIPGPGCEIGGGFGGKGNIVRSGPAGGGDRLK